MQIKYPVNSQKKLRVSHKRSGGRMGQARAKLKGRTFLARSGVLGRIDNFG